MLSTSKRAGRAALFATALALATAPSARAASKPSAAIAAALADPSRPAEDRAMDASRKAADVLAFEGVKPGDTVIERFPGNGYFTRLLSRVVGPRGKVYVMLFKYDDGRVLDIDKAQPLADALPNVLLVANTNAMPHAPEPVDAVISLQNYHDLHVGKAAATGAPEMNALAFQALKPQGVFVVIDHDAPAGAGAGSAPKTHRIEMAAARAEVEAAGFRMVGTSEALRNPADPRTATVSDPSVAGRTDRFMMKFVKAR